MTGLPFIYAAWTGRAGAVTAADVEALQEAQRRACESVDAIAAEYGRGDARRTARAAAYLRDNVKYGLGPDEAAGLQLFLDYAADLGLAPRRRQLEFFLGDDRSDRTEGAATVAASTRPRRWSSIATRRRICSARSPTASAPASIPDRVVTYIIDRNVNYTNICVARCNFCAFYRPVGDSDGYVLGFEEIFRKIDETIAVGGNQLLLQGGHNPDLPIAVVRGSVPRGEGTVSRVQAARAVAAGGAAHLAAQRPARPPQSSIDSSPPASTAFPAAAPRFSSTACASC